MSDHTDTAVYGGINQFVIKAIVLILKDEINILRTKAGLSERTNQQVLNAIGAKLDEIAPEEE